MGGKNKLKRWKEMESFTNVFEPTFEETFNKDFHLKGKWHTEVFKNTNPIVLELGCGRGEYSVGLAKRYPNKNFIGIDIKGARIWRGAKTATEDNISNLVFVRTQIDWITSFFTNNEIEEIWITFPDPQPQESREKKRLTSPRFMDRYKQFLKPDSIIHLKTDNAPFFDYTLDEIKRNNYKLLSSTHNLYKESLDNLDRKTQEILNIKTFYEELFSKKGFDICYLKFQIGQ